MFQLLQTIWFFGIAAIAVPLIIHLFNVKEGKTLKIGSVFLLTESARQQAKSLKLSELLLLFLRCLLITLIAFLLAKPLWTNQLTAKEEKGWLLIEKNNLKETYDKFGALIDSLTKAGYQFHYFNTEFPKANLKDELKLSKVSDDDTISYWTLLKALNEQVPYDLPVHLFTDNSLKRFKGTRPTISMNLQWHTYVSDSSSQWLQQAYRASSDSMKITTAHSSYFNTYYTTQTIASSQISSTYNLFARDAKQYITARDTSIHRNIIADTSTKNITIYNNGFGMDALYLKAAIDAVQQYSKYNMNITTVNRIEDIPVKNDWLFWLSEQDIPASLMNQNVFVYEKGKPQEIHSWINSAGVPAVSGVEVSKWLTASQTSTSVIQPIWYDGYGHPVLTKEGTQNHVYRFYSRFNPQWNGLPWSSDFAGMIYELLFEKNDSKAINQFDKRVIDEQQLLPNISAGSLYSKAKFAAITDLTILFWLLAFFVFVLERFLSFKSKKDTVHA